MKENKISIIINKPTSDVFAFTINPINTSKWIDGIVKEETSEWPVKVGSTYKNVDTSGKWSEYILVSFVENQVFELASREGGYHVRYSYYPISDNVSTLEYFERMDEGNLKDPFSKTVLEKLKVTMEADNN